VNNASRIALICVSALISSATLASDAPRVFSPREYTEEIDRLSSTASSIREHPEAAEQAMRHHIAMAKERTLQRL